MVLSASPPLLLYLLAGFCVAFPPLTAQDKGPGDEPGKELRLLYRLDLETAREAGRISPTVNPAKVLAEQAQLLKRRLVAAGYSRAETEPRGKRGILACVPGAERKALEAIKSLTERRGFLEWTLVVDRNQKEFDLEGERKRLRAWMEKPANQVILGADPLAIHRYNSLSPERGGPISRFIQWIPMHEKSDPQNDLEISLPLSWTDAEGQRHERKARYIPINRMKTRKVQSFSGEDLLPASIKQVQDGSGRPAVAFEIRPGRKADFSRFTGAHVESAFAILLDGYCRSAPVIQDKLPGRGIISLGSRASAEDITALVEILRHQNTYRVRLELVEAKVHGPPGTGSR